MPLRPRAPFAAALTLALAWSVVAVAPAAAAAPKVAIIVGPTGSLTDMYRSQGNQIANAASAAGADVVKVYSPNATWSRVKSAVNGASIVVYLGHGNGFPSPYSSTENTDRVNGWGLNRTRTNGDRDDWSSTMVYCGEKALRGTLTSSDGAAQWKYCGGSKGTDGITPAPGFVMIYNSACYAPGAGETGGSTEAQALARVGNYSYPALKLGAGAYFATDFGASKLVDLILRNPAMAFGEIAHRGNGYVAEAQRHFAHPDVPDAQVWLQRTYAMGRTDYWYAFAGDPTRTPSGSHAEFHETPLVTSVTPGDGQRGVATSARPTAYFNLPMQGVSSTTVTLFDRFGFRVPVGVRWNADTMRATLVPSRSLVTREWYTARLGSGIVSDDATPLTPYEWTFRTKADGGDGVSAYWPTPRPLTFREGTHTGYQFDADGDPTATMTATLDADASAQTDTRRMLPSQSGYWFHVLDGPWAGYWIRQSDALYLSEFEALMSDVVPVAWETPVEVTVRKGTHTGYRFDPSGAMTDQRTATRAAATVIETDSLEVVDNQAGSWFHVLDGAWAGYWLRASDVVALKSG